MLKAKAPMAADDPKLEFYISSAVTDYDRRQANRRGYNPYALSHYLGAVQAIIADVQAGQDVRASILDRTCGRLTDTILRAIGHPVMTLAEAKGQ